MSRIGQEGWIFAEGHGSALSRGVVPITDHSSPITVSVCFHCHQPIPRNIHLLARIGQRAEPVCCEGCRAVAEWISGAGLADYYRFRETPAVRATQLAAKWQAYDQPDVLARFTRVAADGTRSATLVLEGLGCAACGWLIDKMLKRTPGVIEARTHIATARHSVRWRPEVIEFSQILQRLAQLGFTPHVADAEPTAAHIADERRKALKRLGVAGLGMMQVMMFAVAFYVGDIAVDTERYFRLVSLLVTTPVLWYAGAPFFLNAWRALHARTVTMDVPVSVALALAYVASVLNTFDGVGAVYFDSVTMFIFLLTLARFVEMTARHRTLAVTDALTRLVPAMAQRVSKTGSIETVATATLVVGDVILVRGGEIVPADGVIVDGTSRFDESMLTGESRPQTRTVGATVVAGALNLTQPLQVRVTAVGAATAVAHIARLAMGVHDESPQLTAADRIAAWFLSRIMVATAGVAALWLAIDPSRAFETTLAVLVVTCPCALSLAMPTAVAAATAALVKRGILVTDAAALDHLARVTHVVFDKTGTLTHGEPVIESEAVFAAIDPRVVRHIAAALEQASEHPLARAFQMPAQPVPPVTEVRIDPGRGVEGVVDGRRYRIGARRYVAELRGAHSAPDEDERIFLGDTTEELAAYSIGDRLRCEAPDTIAALRARGIDSEVLSGDAWVTVARTAAVCGIESFTARQAPFEKLNRVRELLASGRVVAMVGDGVNDAPVLRAASVSIAMARATALAQASADVLLVADRLDAIPFAIDVARRTQRIIRQNLYWGAAYNIVALPLAALGWISPWIAAVGMAASSMFVVLNALRLMPANSRGTADAQHEMRAAQSSDWRVATHDL